MLVHAARVAAQHLQRFGTRRGGRRSILDDIDADAAERTHRLAALAAQVGGS